MGRCVGASLWLGVAEAHPGLGVRRSLLHICFWTELSCSLCCVMLDKIPALRVCRSFHHQRRTRAVQPRPGAACILLHLGLANRTGGLWALPSLMPALHISCPGAALGLDSRAQDGASAWFTCCWFEMWPRFHSWG